MERTQPMGLSREGRGHARLDWMLLLAIGLLACIVRVWLVRAGRVVWGDEPFYLWLGRNWISGQGYSFTGHPDVHHSPLFPWLIGLLYLVTRNMALASEILYVLLGSLLVLPVYAIGRAVYDRRVGLGAAALTAIFPALTASVLHWGTMTEPLYMLMVYVGLWAGLVILSAKWRMASETPTAKTPADPWWAYLVAGLAFGLAYLTRPEAITYFVVAGAFFVLLRLLQRRWDMRFPLKMLLYIVAFGLAFGPYAYYTYLNTGAWMVSEKVGVAYLTGIGLAYGDTAAFDRATWGLDSTGLETFFFSSESYNVSMLQLILADPRTFFSLLILNTERFVYSLIDWTLFPQVLLLWLVLGLFARGWTRERTLKELFLLASALPVLSFILFFIQARYIVAFIPVMILWTARGLLEFSDWLTGTVAAVRNPAPSDESIRPQSASVSGFWRAAFQIGPVVLVMAVLLVMHPTVVRQVTNVGSVRPEHRSVGEYLAGIVSRDAIIMSRYPAIAFHADARWVPTPNASWPEVLNYARHKGVKYFVIDERELRYRPQFKDLVSGGAVPPQLKLMYVDETSRERLVVYEWID